MLYADICFEIVSRIGFDDIGIDAAFAAIDDLESIDDAADVVDSADCIDDNEFDNSDLDNGKFVGDLGAFSDDESKDLEADVVVNDNG